MSQDLRTTAIRHDVSLLTPDDLYLFNEGTHHRLQDKLGAHPLTLGHQDAPLPRPCSPDSLKQKTRSAQGLPEQLAELALDERIEGARQRAVRAGVRLEEEEVRPPLLESVGEALTPALA